MTKAMALSWSACSGDSRTCLCFCRKSLPCYF